MYTLVIPALSWSATAFLLALAFGLSAFWRAGAVVGAAVGRVMVGRGEDRDEQGGY